MPRSGRRIEKSSFAPAYQIFLDLLKKERVAKDLSQRQLGKLLGKHHNFVSACEMGDRTLNFVEVRAWVMVLGLDWVEFTRKVDEAIAAQNVPTTSDNPNNENMLSPTADPS